MKNTEGMAMKISEKDYKRMPAELRALFVKLPNLGSDEVIKLLPEGADRFFYCTKASKKEKSYPVKNNHPTVKPLELIKYLVRLTRTPNGGTVIDPFMGSGTCGVACVIEDRDFIGIDMDENYVSIAKQRIEHEIENMDAK